MKLDINSCKKLVFFQLFFILFEQFLMDTLRLPSFFVLISDIVTLLLLTYMLHARKLVFLYTKTIFLRNFFVIASVFIILGGLFNFVYPQYFLWGARKFIRGFVFFMACIMFLNVNDYYKMLQSTFKIQIINIILTFYQYFVLGLRQDHLGGIFGTSSGCNAQTNLFFCIIVIYFVSEYMNKKKGVGKLILIISSTLIISAAAELKFFFVEFVIIMILTLLFTKPSMRTVVWICLAILFFIIGMNTFEKLFPEFYYRMLDIESVIGLGRDIGTGYNISRLGAFSEIEKMFFQNNFFKGLVGMGLGNCETAPFDLFTSTFYKQYGFLNYIWLGHAITFLELGYIGVFLLVLFYIYTFAYTLKNRKSIRINHSELYLFSLIFSVIIIINLFYNNFVRADFQYIVYAGLAVPFVCYESFKKDECLTI